MTGENDMSQTHVLSNGYITATFSTKGAELISLKNADGKEFMFRDPLIWGYTAPVLFPICGGLKDDKFILDGKEYNLAKHGFCRDAEFTVESISDTSITFIFTETAETLVQYPFSFEFRIVYTLDKDSISVEYRTTNKNDKDMYYSVGCHEAYLCPEGIENYSILFDKKETLDSHIVNGNLMDYKTERILEDSDVLELKYDYFSIDALVFSKFNSSCVTLCSKDGERIVKVDFPEFTHLLFWTKNCGNAPYICIEPWCGFPDMIDSEYDITKRPGIIKVAPRNTHSVTHTITFVK